MPKFGTLNPLLQSWRNSLVVLGARQRVRGVITSCTASRRAGKNYVEHLNYDGLPLPGGGLSNSSKIGYTFIYEGKCTEVC